MAGTTAAAVLGLQHRLTRHKERQQAEVMAWSGRDLAQAWLRSGRWHAPLHFRAPRMATGGWFVVDVDAAGRIVVSGYCGRERVQL